MDDIDKFFLEVKQKRKEERMQLMEEQAKELENN